MSSGKVNCTCGWSWNKSDSSAKDMYICHECGRDNSNNMKNGGWLDNYGTQANYNDSKATASPDMRGDGFSNVGRNYSPAWGGQFEDGGEIPNAQNGKATRADSLAVLNSQLALNKFYDREVKAGRLKKSTYKFPVKLSEKELSNLNKENLKFYRGEIKARENQSYGGTWDDKYKKFFNLTPAQVKKLEYEGLGKTKSSTNNKVYYRDVITPQQNLAAPFALIDSRIGAQGEVAYDEIRDYPGGMVSVYDYDPLAVKPFDLLTDAEKKLRVQKYGTDGVPKSYLDKKTNKTKQKEKEIFKPIQNPNVKAIQNNLQPEGVIQSDAKLNADVSSLRPKIKQPEYYDITSQRQNMSGLSDYYNYNKQKMNVDDAVRATEAAETYNKYIEEKYGKEALKNPKAQERLKQLKQNVEIVPQAQKGKKLTFLQPTSNKLPEGYRIPYDTPSTERASSIGGTNGEPAYLVPEFKYGEPLYDPIEEFKRTGEHLGGPFKTWQEAEEWENTVRHPAVENRETIMFPQEKFQTGGSIPGSVGFTYARTKGIPSNGPYAKKTLASAQNGQEMQYYQNGLDFKPKSISRDGGWLNKYEQAQNGKKFKLKDERIQDNIQPLSPRQKKGNELLIKETEKAKKDKQELTTTGQIKNPRSIRYKKLAPKQSDLKTQTKSNEELEGQLGLERPLVYLASPEKLLGDIGVPGMETSELDRQAVMANRFNPNQSREERFINNTKLGLGYVPEAAANTAMAAAFMPEGSGALGLVNEALNPLAGLKMSIAPELRQGLKTNGIFSPEYLEGLKRTATKKLFDSRSASTEENLKRFKLLTSPKTLKAIGNVDAPIADKMLYNFMTDRYPSVKQFRTDVKKATLEANRIKKLNPEFDFSPDIFKDPDLVNHANDYLLSKPEYLSKFVNAKKAAEKTIANKQNVKSFLEKEYVKKIDLINQDPILKNIAQESPQYVDDIYNHLKNPNKSTDEFVNDLIKQSNTFTRSMHKSMKSGDINKEDFFIPKGSSWGFANKKTIDVEGFPTSDMRGEYGNNKYKIFPNEERMIDIANTPLEERWAKRFPNTFAGNENIDFGIGLHSGVENDFLHKAITQRRIRNNMLINSGSAPIQPKIINSEIIPHNYLYQPKHVVFNTPEQGELVKGFDVEQVSDVWNPFKPSGKFGLEPGYTKGFKEGGIIKDDRGQWEHPGEITEIGSNQITMQGVPYDVLGISDTGDTKLMKPGKDYKFKGKKVTEFPMARNGRRQEQKGLVNLDDLTNFTNYNKQQPAGWLSKYN